MEGQIREVRWGRGGTSEASRRRDRVPLPDSSEFFHQPLPPPPPHTPVPHRFATTLISVKAGIKHLQDKIENAREDAGGLRTELQDESVVTVLRESEDTLLTLFNRVKANQAEEGAIFGQPEQEQTERSNRYRRTESIHGSEAIDELDEEELRENRPYNQRIDLPLPGDGEYEHEHEENLGDLDEEELTRDKVKKASSQILVAQDRKQKKLRKKARNAGVQ
jgi:hypothetical protein